MSTKKENVVCRASYCKVFFGHFLMSEFFNGHAIYRQQSAQDRGNQCQDPFRWTSKNERITVRIDSLVSKQKIQHYGLESARGGPMESLMLSFCYLVYVRRAHDLPGSIDRIRRTVTAAQRTQVCNYVSTALPHHCMIDTVRGLRIRIPYDLV
jgi:hypothetical protein